MTAMVETVADHGYAGATVSRVVEFAGVSRATFYEHFSSREDCFLAVYRYATEKVRLAVGEAMAGAPPEARVETCLDALLTALAAEPAIARLVAVEFLGAPTSVRLAHEKVLCEIEALVSGFLDGQTAPHPVQIPARALIAGIGDVIARKVLAGESHRLPELRGDLLTWIDAYRLPPAESPVPQQDWKTLGRFARLVDPNDPRKPVLLPRGRGALTSGNAGHDRRQRLLEATARLAAADGYDSLTVARIAAAARVPRAAFYAFFERKQDVVVAAQAYALQSAVGIAASEYSALPSWPERVWSAAEGLLTYIAANPNFARLAFVECFAVGPRAVELRQQYQMVFGLFIGDGFRQAAPAAALPPLCSEAITGAVFGLVQPAISNGRGPRLLSLLPAVAYTTVAPFIGPREAAALVEGRARAAP